MAKIKYGQISVGHAHANKMSVYRASDDYDVVGVVEPNEALRQRAMKSDTYRDLKWMTQDELLNVPGLQVVGVETRVRDLLKTAETCVDAGMNIHLDKPAGESLPHFKRVLDKAARKHLVLQMGYMYRYSPAVVLMRECLEKGWLGEPFEVHTVMSKVVASGTRKQLAEYPGGIMFELGCHIMDLVLGVLGTPKSVTPYTQHASPAKDQLVDNMLTVLEYPHALATVKSSAMEVEGFARRHFVVCGSEGTFHIQPLDAPNVRVAFSKPHGKYAKGYQEIKFGRYSRYVGDAADLAKIVRGEKEPSWSPEHDYNVQKAVMQASGLDINK